MKRFRFPIALSSLAVAAASGFSASAQVFTWTPTASSNSYDWNNPANWNPAGFPDAAGAVANVNNDILGGQTIRLREDISIGTLNLGDAAGSGNNFAFTIGNASGETFSLTFDSGSAGTPAVLSNGSTGTTANVISAPISLNSNLVVNLGGTDATNRQVLTISGATSVNGRTVTFTGGVAGQNQVALNGDVAGSGTLINNSNTVVAINGSKAFTGTVIANKGSGGSNTGSFYMIGGSLANAAEFVINGALSAGNTQSGGLIRSGSGTAVANNPGQRFTTNRITLNGGTLISGGQPATVGAANPWQQGLEPVQDSVSVVDFNSGYNDLALGVGGNTAGTYLNVTTLERSPGASVYLHSTTLGGTARFNADNATTFLRGAGGPEGSSTMSIIPWIGANNGSAGTSFPTGFATVGANGVRALDLTTETANSINAGSTANVNLTAAFTLAAPTTVNSLRYSSGATTNMGAGQTLTLTSGGLYFNSNNGAIGGAGNANAGTLAFGSAEAVIWSNLSNVNQIGASISGSGGITKAGTGTLILTGDNSYSGLTYVGGGTVQVGDGTFASDLGLSLDVRVANGATLSLFNDNAIADSATLTLASFGLANGKLQLNSGVNETVGALFFNNAFAPAGTYGGTGSGATFVNDTYFGGNGVLTVVPEPATASVLFAGFGALLLSRRNRRAAKA